MSALLSVTLLLFGGRGITAFSQAPSDTSGPNSDRKDLIPEVPVAVPSPLPSQPRGPRREQGFRMPHGAATQREDFQGAGEYAGGATSGLGSAKPPPVGDVAHSSAQEWDPKSPCSNFTHLRIPVSVSTEQLFQAIMQSICQRNISLQGTVHACVCMCACVCMFV